MHSKSFRVDLKIAAVFEAVSVGERSIGAGSTDDHRSMSGGSAEERRRNFRKPSSQIELKGLQRSMFTIFGDGN
jgi:hypothetical protein